MKEEPPKRLPTDDNSREEEERSEAPERAVTAGSREAMPERRVALPAPLLLLLLLFPVMSLNCGRCKA